MLLQIYYDVIQRQLKIKLVITINIIFYKEYAYYIFLFVIRETLNINTHYMQGIYIIYYLYDMHMYYNRRYDKHFHTETNDKYFIKNKAQLTYYSLWKLPDD